PHEPPLWMVAPIGLLAVLCVVVGVLPALTVGPGLKRAAVAVLGGDSPRYTLALWHGLTPALVMSPIALLAGAAGHGVLRRRLLANRRGPLGPFNGKLIFERLLQFIGDTGPGYVKRLFPGERLQPQVLFIVVVALLAGVAAAGSARLQPGREALTTIDP